MLRFQHLKQLISRAFQVFSDNTACDDLSCSLTYAELDRKCACIQQTIATHSGSRIGLCAPKSADSFATVLAVLRTGCCLVPVDSLSPFSRQLQIIKNSQMSGLIAERAVVDKILEINGEVVVREIEQTGLFYLTFPRIQPNRLNEHLAYILYTSGSTGEPKGVMISQENALSFIQWVAEGFDFSQNDVFASIAPFHFDLSIFDLFVVMWHGGQVVLFGDKHIRNPLMLSTIIEQRKISVWYSTPTVLTLMIQYGKMHKNDHSSIRKVYYAGEVFPIEALIALKEKWKQADFYNFYGPTETNVCTWINIPETIDQDYDPSIIGQSCKHVDCQVYANDKIQVPSVGLEGELVVSGAAVSPGYLGIASSSHFRDEEEVVWYKTGDWVRVTDTLNFKFLGRKDRMIKRRGYRIELDEIEKAIESYEPIIRAGAISLNVSGQWVVKVFFEKKSPRVDLEELKQFLANRIPSYMLPDHWQHVEKLPMTSTHKIDYQQLSKF